MHRAICILVTGGAGFIGSNLCHLLINQGLNVICLDNFDNYYEEEIKLNNIRNLLDNPLFNLVKGDVRDAMLLEDIFSTHSVEAVVHLAAKAGVRHSISNPEEYYDVNVNGSTRLLEAMRKRNVLNLIYSSSSSVYGDKSGKFSETQVCDTQISPYARSKYEVERLNYIFHRQYDFNVINLRLFSVYGRNQRPDLVLHKFFDRITKKQPIEVYGSIQTTRDYTYIDDTISAFLLSLDYLRKNRNTYQIFNIGNGNPVSLRKLISLISKTMNQNEVDIRIEKFVTGEAKHTHADIQKAKTLLGYSPKVSIELGIELFNDWYSRTHQSGMNMPSCKTP